MLSEREADEVARHGEVLRWSSSESEGETEVFSSVKRREKTVKTTTLGNSEDSKEIEFVQDSDDERPIVQTLNKDNEKTKLGNSEDSKETESE